MAATPACAASYTHIIFLKYLWKILEIAVGVNPFVSNGEPRLNVPSRSNEVYTCIFLPKSDNFSHRVIIAISKNGRKQVKKFGQPWLILTVRISFSLSFFIVPRRRLGQERLRKNEKASSLYRLRQLTITKKMKRCVPLRWNVAEKPRGMRLKFVLSRLRTCTHEKENMYLNKSQSSPTP